MPRIERYSFGEVVIDGQSYREDVIILPDRVISSWWRKEGHSLDPDDLVEVLQLKPETFIMGCGAFGVLAYIAQQAVKTYGWLVPGEMLDGLVPHPARRDLRQAVGHKKMICFPSSGRSCGPRQDGRGRVT